MQKSAHEAELVIVSPKVALQNDIKWTVFGLFIFYSRQNKNTKNHYVLINKL